MQKVQYRGTEMAGGGDLDVLVEVFSDRLLAISTLR